MKCNNCKAEWTPPKGVSISNCPFCGKPIFEVKDSDKNSEPHEILQKIVQQYDRKKLGDTLLKGMLSDLMPHVEKKYQRIFKQALDDKIGSKLLELEDEDNSIRIVKTNTLKDSFKNNNGFDNTADYVVDCFLFALGWIETINKEQYGQSGVDNLSIVSQQIDISFIDGVLNRAEAIALFSSAKSLGISENEMAGLMNAKIKILKLKPYPVIDNSLKNLKDIICSSDWYSVEKFPKESTYPVQTEKVEHIDETPGYIETSFGLHLEMVFVKGGTFQMGNDEELDSDGGGKRQVHSVTLDETPLHSVTLSDFYIGKYEVTQRQWQDVMANNPSNFLGFAECPVEQVSWDDVQKFIVKLNKKTGKNYRLPTEAEWEYAARGGVKSKGYIYSGNDNNDEVAWYDKNSQNKTHPVGKKKANELGLYDMSGNVWEFCQDWYGDYTANAQTNPKGPDNGSCRVIRGGSWIIGKCRSAYRGSSDPDDCSIDFGFRLVSPR